MTFISVLDTTDIPAPGDEVMYHGEDGWVPAIVLETTHRGLARLHPKDHREGWAQHGPGVKEWLLYGESP